MCQAMYLQRYRVSYNKTGKSTLVMGTQKKILKRINNLRRKLVIRKQGRKSRVDF